LADYISLIQPPDLTFSDHVQLDCEMNAVVTGASNLVKQALGQCATFTGFARIIVGVTGLNRDSNGNVLINPAVLSNKGGLIAMATQITVAKIGSTNSTMKDPAGPVDIAPGDFKFATLVFPPSVGASETHTLLTIGGIYVTQAPPGQQGKLGCFNFTLRITLP
jgi:hypothetical protein